MRIGVYDESKDVIITGVLRSAKQAISGDTAGVRQGFATRSEKRLVVGTGKDRVTEGNDMEWVRNLYEPYVQRTFKWENRHDCTPLERQQRFERIFSETMVTVLVQEPWHGTVRFKGLARYYADEVGMLITDPVAYLTANFGGGKFKLNFHHGWNFVATINFKTQGESKWEDLPGIDF